MARIATVLARLPGCQPDAVVNGREESSGGPFDPNAHSDVSRVHRQTLTLIRIAIGRLVPYAKQSSCEAEVSSIFGQVSSSSPGADTLIRAMGVRSASESAMTSSRRSST